MTTDGGLKDSLADALAARALDRCAAALAVAATCLTALALVFLLLADGRLGTRSLPQLLVLGWAAVVALVGAARCAAGARAVRRGGTSGRATAADAPAQPVGPAHAAGAADLLGRVAVAAGVGGALVAVGCVVALTPRVETLLSSVLSLAVVGQVTVLALVQRAPLRRAARRPGSS